MTDDAPLDVNDQGPSSGDWDAIELLHSRARAAAARRDASIAELRQVMDDEEVLAAFGIDLSRLEG